MDRGAECGRVVAPARATDVARSADLLILAAPPAANINQLDALVPHLKPGAVVTDVGSVKRAIVARAEQLGLHERFAGSHPLAGTHRHGFEASRPDLFRRAVVYVTPCRHGETAAREIVPGDARGLTAWLTRAAEWRRGVGP